MWRMRKMAGVDTESRQLAGAYAKMRKL
jgi:hypothetical protein